MENGKWKIAEACEAENRNDFVHKLGIATKERPETRIWFRMSAPADLLPSNRLQMLFDESEQLGTISGRSVITAKSDRSARGN